MEKKINHSLNYEVICDDLPIIELIPPDLLDSFVSGLESEIMKIIKEKERKHNYYLEHKSTKKVPP